MSTSYLISWLLLASSLTSLCAASNILVLMPVGSKSHKIAADPLMEELAKRGHKVTEVTLFKTSRPHPNIRSIELKTMKEFFDKIIKSRMMTSGNFARLLPMRKSFYEGTKILLNDEHFKNFINDPGHFDVVITSTVMNDLTLMMIPIIVPGVPLILLSPSNLAPNVAWALNIPFPTSYVPIVVTPFSSQMTFIQRVINTVIAGLFDQIMNFVIVSPARDALESFFTDVTIQDARKIEQTASMVLVNSHFTLAGSKPSLPCAVEVGGMHCRAAEKLPQEFNDFVEGSGEHGFIVFSLGSVVQAELMPIQLIESFKAAFKEISPVRVIWKYEGKLEGLSPNVLISKWIPQQDLIGHPKCRLAITHGGLLSLQEANYHGVPLLGVPVGGADRDSNTKLAIDRGLAEMVDIEKLTPEIALDAIKSIVFNPKYKETAEQFGKLMRDRPQAPVDTAAYWVEYVVRHKGAPHLKPDIAHLNFFQYFLLDVFAFLFVVISALILLIYLALRACFRCICKSKKKSKYE